MGQNWPFKGKPMTNATITVTIGLFGEVVWLVLLLMYPPQVMGLTALVALCLLIRVIYRGIRAEWR